MALPIDPQILDDARAGRDQTIEIAAAVLKAPCKQDRVVYSEQDYGDGVALSRMADFVASCLNENVLKPGERLEVQLRVIAFGEMLQVSTRSRMPEAVQG